MKTLHYLKLSHLSNWRTCVTTGVMILNGKIPRSFAIALNELRSGGVVAIPTETVYGLAADIRNSSAIEKIFKLKERPAFDPLIVHIENFSSLGVVARDFPPLAQKLADAFWPGPLTMVLPRREDLNSMITSGLDTVAVRMPANELTRALIRELGAPIAAPSANRFGRTSPTTAAHVESEFCTKCDECDLPILDDGPCTVGIESTVIGFLKGDRISILRPGAVTAEQLAKFGPVKQLVNSSQSPGHLLHHYMPEVPLVILSNDQVTPSRYEQIRHELKMDVLHPGWMTLPEDPTLTARLLYAEMRAQAEAQNVNCLFLNYPIQERRSDLWAGISDRIEKAATIVI